MTATKLIQSDRFRLVRVHRGFSVVEGQAGSDWLGVERWHELRGHPDHGANFVTYSVNGENVQFVRRSLFLEVINELADALMRAKKRGKRRRAGGGK